MLVPFSHLLASRNRSPYLAIAKDSLLAKGATTLLNKPNPQQVLLHFMDVHTQYIPYTFPVIILPASISYLDLHSTNKQQK